MHLLSSQKCVSITSEDFLGLFVSHSTGIKANPSDTANFQKVALVAFVLPCSWNKKNLD